MKIIVVVLGNAGHGKSRFADMLVESVLSAEVINFADEVKLAARHLIGIPLSVSHGSQKTKNETLYYGKSVRHWLQWLGTEVGRIGVDRDVWVDRFLDRVDESSKTMIVVGDGRFPDTDIYGLKERAVERDLRVVSVIIRRRAVPVTSNHSSEQVIAKTPDDEFDYKIENNSDLAALRRAAEDLLRQVVKRS